MMRPPFPGHRRYSITHRAVQRLRELVPDRDDEDDETLRDRLDHALGEAEDSGQAIRTLDAMLGEPQTLIPIKAFGDLLYAIIKEDTVVTVLPQGHGEEILQRGQAMEQRVAKGHAQVRPVEREEERWEGPRRRWRKEAPQPVVIERIVRGNGAPSGHDDELTHEEPETIEPETTVSAGEEPGPEEVIAPRAVEGPTAKVVQLPERPKPEGPVAAVLHEALAEGRRRAAVMALTEVLQAQGRDASLLPVWNELAEEGVPQTMTVGDLIEAVQALR